MANTKEVELRFSPSYIIIPMVTVAVAVLSQHFNSTGIEWFATLELPQYTPHAVVINLVWSLIYITTTGCAVLSWEGLKRDREFIILFLVFILNACFNVLFSILFSHMNLLAPAVIDAVLVHLTVLIIFLILLRRAHHLSVLMLPYVAWSGFAAFLMYQVWLLNA